MGLRQDTFDVAAGTTHTNSTTEASIARRLFAAGDLQVGMRYAFECGVIVGSAQSTDTVLLAVRFGSSATVTSNSLNSIVGFGLTNINGAAIVGTIAGVITGNAYLTLLDAATGIVIMGEMAECDAISTMTMKPFVYVFTSVANTAYYLDISADWSVAHADNQIASAGWAVDQIA